MRYASCLFPAVLAALVLAFLPSCAMYRSAAPAVGPIERPHVVERVAPRDPDAPDITRGAGERLWYGINGLSWEPDEEASWGIVYLCGGLLFAAIIWIVFELIALAIDAALESDESGDAQALLERRKKAVSP